MSLVRFQDHLFLEYRGFLFVLEASWDCFRPIQGVAWTGKEWEIQDRHYCQDPFDPLYGYGSDTMKKACLSLTAQFADAPEARVVSYPSLGTLEWFRDRRIMLTPCAPRDTASWRQMHKGRIRTGKVSVRNRFTRRNR